MIRINLFIYIIMGLVILQTVHLLLNDAEFMFYSCTLVSDECFHDPTWLQELLD